MFLLPFSDNLKNDNFVSDREDTNFMKKSIKLIFLLPVLLLGACSPRNFNLTVMTYNVGIFGKYMEDSSEDIASLVNSLDVDAVALNELDSCNRRHNVYQAEEFALKSGGRDYAYSGSIRFAGGSYGNAIVTRDSILHEEKMVLPMSDGDEKRSLLLVETEKYIIACTHLDHKGKQARSDQMRFVDSWIREKYGNSDKPVFLCGDLNSTPDSPVVKELLGHWTLLSSREYSWPSKVPVKCLDYILCLNPDRVENIRSVRISKRKNLSQYSDHLPKIVRMKIKE